jgi:hypothetical protein
VELEGHVWRGEGNFINGSGDETNGNIIGEDWRISFKCIMKRWDGRVLTGFSWLRIAARGWIL